MKLKIGLKRIGSIIFGMVLEQEEIPIGEFTKNVDCFTIESDLEPELTNNCLFIRGKYQEKDNDVFYYDYGTEGAAIDAYNKIVKLVRIINGPKPPYTNTHGLDMIS